jgi:LPXTG-motif cell wall-anchored protein
VTVTDPAQTVTVAGPVTTVTVTQSLAGATSTVTETVAQTVIVSPSASILGVSVERVLVTSTVTKFNCPPGAAVQGGSLAYTGGGNDATLSLLGGALTAGGAVFLLMSRKRRPARTH